MTTTRADWADGPLYTFMMETFPEHRSMYQILDVQRLKRELGRSHERIYQWLRKSKLTPGNARAICELANSEANVAALAKVNRTPPEIHQFNRFVYAD